MSDLVAKIMGLSEEEARKLLAEAAATFRIVERDGEKFIRTCDYKSFRLNLYIANSKIYKVTFG
jgi:hypothetical protein